jgi:hypothetical protein
MNKKKTTHGGKRAHSGRKPRETPLVALTVRLKPDVSERLQSLKARLGISVPATIERLLDVAEPALLAIYADREEAKEIRQLRDTIAGQSSLSG